MIDLTTISSLPMNEVLAQTLADLMSSNSQIMYLDADLARSLIGKHLQEFHDRYPGQFFDVGIQEANMVSVAAGLSATGKIPFVHSFATFISRRACDQVFMSGCYARNNIRLIGSDPGILAAYNGGTHMPFEDIGIFRSIPTMTILEPADCIAAANLIYITAAEKGIFYIRFNRKTTESIYKPDAKFAIGSSNMLTDGTDVSILTSGIMVAESMKAAKILSQKKISARVVDLYSIKPIDSEMICRCAKETGAIVTAENHNIIGGLGDAVLHELAINNIQTKVKMIGVNDSFGQVGPVDYLKTVYHLTAEDIVNAACEALSVSKITL